MLPKLLLQTLLATSVLQFVPLDMAQVQHYATLPEPEVRLSGSLYDAYNFVRSPLPVAEAKGPEKVQPYSLGVVTSARSAIVMDRESGAVLFEKNASEPRSIGSITKLMSAYVFLQMDPDLDALASIESADIRYGGIQHVRANDDVRIRDLLHASLIASDNSATASLVRLSGLSQSDFVAKMNDVAKELDLQGTTFVDETGLSADNRSIVPDIAKMLDHLLKDDLIAQATSQSKVSFLGQSGQFYSMSNTNELLESYLNESPYDIIGGKTGFLPAAGYCLGSIIENDQGNEIIVVALGSDTKLGRFKDVKALAAWAYKVFSWNSESTDV